MPHDVFISHSAKDKLTGDAVCAMLEASGIRCWIAPRDVTPGMEWSECIIDAIAECRIMVLVFTTHANASPQIRKEVERAVNHGVAILPLRVEDVIPGRALEFFIGNAHWLDAMTPPLEDHLKSLAGTVKMLLARMPSRDAPGPIPLIQPLPPELSKLDVTEPVLHPEAKPIPSEGPGEPRASPVASDVSWQIGDTLIDSVVSKSRIDRDTTAKPAPPAEEPASQPPPSPLESAPQPSSESAAIPRTEPYRGTSTLGNLSTGGSAVNATAASNETTPSRPLSKTSLILIAIAVVGAAVIFGLNYRSSKKAADSAAAQSQNQRAQLSTPSATQSSQPSAAERGAPTVQAAPAKTSEAQAPAQPPQKGPIQNDPPSRGAQSVTNVTTRLDCSSERSLGAGTGDAARMEFVNQSLQPIKIFWIDQSGTRVLYEILNSGSSYSVDTYLTHPWVIANEAGECQAIYMPVRGTSIVDYQGPSTSSK